MRTSEKRGRRVIIAVTAAAVILYVTLFITVSMCGKGKDKDGGGASGDTGAPVSSADARTAEQKAEYNWILEPSVEADDIDVIFYDRPAPLENEFYREDLNSVSDHLYGDISLIRRDGAYGLINIGGGMIADAKMREVFLGYGKRIIMVAESTGEYDRILTPLNEVVRIGDDQVNEIFGSETGPTPVWVEDHGLFTFWSPDVNNKCGPEEIAEMNDFAACYESSGALYYNEDGFSFINLSDGRQSILLRKGEPISRELYDDAGAFACGVIPVCRDGKWGYVDSQGSTVLPFEFDGIAHSSGRVDSERANNASDNYIAVSKDGMFALYDVGGHIVIDYGEFEVIRPVYEGMCWVRRNGLWGVLALREDARPYDTEQPETVVSENGVPAAVHYDMVMRVGPGDGCKVCALIHEGESVVLCGITGEWSYIRCGGMYGWVRTAELE